MPDYDVRALVLCVVLNAFPKVSGWLQDQTPKEAAQYQVFKEHGGTRFGEKDNREDLRVLQSWLDSTTEPSLGGVLDGLKWKDAMRMDLDPLQCQAAQGLAEQAATRWVPGARIPTVLVVRGPDRLPVLCDTVLDFDASDKAARREDREKARETADVMRKLAAGAGVREGSCGEVVQALGVLRRWLERPGTSAVCSNEVGGLLQADTWDVMAERLDARLGKALCAEREAERRPRFELRVALVRQDDGALVVVRRFGRGHISVLTDSGICQPRRMQDIGGAVVESLWACVESDGDGEASGRTADIVADPDDEIFCRECGYGESFSYDQIVLCDGCDGAVHQMCHVPVVTEKEVLADQWFCRRCRKAKSKRPRTK
ncbi:hypothetical protein GGF46_000006 [Coemansia sp. RSA 552]|nr:hypothetical protein GGF46_000006 [Coemansia sp. RSA 552]